MYFESINPATEETLEHFEQITDDVLDQVLTDALKAQRSWALLEISERGDLLQKVQALLLENKENYARLMTSEMGKIYLQGIAEIEKCALGCQYYINNAEKFLQTEEVETEADYSYVTYKPLGVVLAIMPWNFPFWQIFRFAAPALMAGNGVLLKHAPNVTGCALAMEELFRAAGFPEHLFRTLVIDISQTTEVIHDKRVAAVTITASVNAGRAVAAEAGKALKKCVLELGGSDAYIVLEDADIDKAVEAGVVARFQNSGQSCIAAKRFIVVDGVYEEFEEKFVAAVKQLEMGDPAKEATYIGPLARIDLRDGLASQVNRTVEAGAKILLGGKVPEGKGAFYPATVIADVKPGMAAWSEELFGPVAALIRVKDEAEAIEVANCTEYGLGGAVWTQNIERGEQIAANHIESGAAFVNDMSKSDPRMPFGGIKHSGYGRELSIYGIREFVNAHAVWVNRLG